MKYPFVPKHLLKFFLFYFLGNATFNYLLNSHMFSLYFKIFFFLVSLEKKNRTFEIQIKHSEDPAAALWNPEVFTSGLH